MELLKKLVKLCDALNRAMVRYVVIGGFAVILHGYFRTTHDIDLLIEPSPENIKKLKKALHELLGSDEVFEIHDDDITRYAIVRFAPESEEIVIDLIGKIGEISFEVAIKDIEEVELEGVKISLCGLSTLIETKKGVRPKDKEDLLFLLGKKEYLEKQSLP
ncbi:MAG: nucleotidyl transferase AbiEii/AbiGii toxin family protein [Nitrospinota bacterium]